MAVAAIAARAAVLPAPAFALGPPRTLAIERHLGNLVASSAPVDPGFPVQYVGVSWTDGPNPFVRFLVNGRWTKWEQTEHDELPNADGRTFAALLAAPNADAYQVRGRNRSVQAVAINTTDGPRELQADSATAEASHLSQPSVISRAGWGADESYRFTSNGSEKWPPTFYGTKMLIVHHTAGKNNDPNPAATVRAIYHYHAITRGWGDIGYNFLVDAQGRIYKGRYSGPAGTRNSDTLTGENANGLGVSGAHTGGWNSGTMGIAVLGTYTSVRIPKAARSSVVNHLAWEAERHSIDPLATKTFTNPSSGARKSNPTISGHRDWTSTECPGDKLDAALPGIRRDVSVKLATQTKSFPPSSVVVRRGTTASSVADLASNDDAYYSVTSVQPRSLHVADWYGVGTIDVAGVKRLTLTYTGSATSSVSQYLYAYNFSNRAWQKVSSATLSTTERTFSWSTTNPRPFISGSGESRFRVRSTDDASFTSNGDVMQFRVDY
ncbi:MAG: N-acetylmuramoyl-L-alanine amidase [Actinomycetota bacterium]|nr:N-acetylmuramoyl-L-alanine amidase [Actinomycetota bacterium]